jgi:MarR family transcriptional regulator, organic hydroperoxide resistance regulator
VGNRTGDRLVVARAKKKPGKAFSSRAQSRAKTVLATVGNRGSGKEAGGLFDDFLPHLIARLAYLLDNDLTEKLRHEGINVARWRILAVLAMGDGITISEIIDRAMMQQSALSRVLMTMEEEEYVRRVPRREDARYVEVFLTERGRALFHSLDPVVRRRQGRLLKDLTRQEVDGAFELLRRLIHNLSE